MLGLTITEAFMDYVVRANITDPGPRARLLLCLEVRAFVFQETIYPGTFSNLV
jgi:hypothetical protein